MDNIRALGSAYSLTAGPQAGHTFSMEIEARLVSRKQVQICKYHISNNVGFLGKQYLQTQVTDMKIRIDYQIGQLLQYHAVKILGGWNTMIGNDRV